MTKSTYTVGSIFVLYITTSVVTYATQCCFHGPGVNQSQYSITAQCTTVLGKADCDQKPPVVFKGVSHPPSSIPGQCTTSTSCCPSKTKGDFSTNISDIILEMDQQCIEHRLSVELSKFATAPTDKGIFLNWKTKTELDSQGFRIWRAIPDLSRYCGCSGNIEDYTQIQVLDKEGKPVLIPAKGSKTSGFDYSYLDEEAKPGIAYCYALEDVDSKGESKFYFEYVAFTPDGLPKEKR